MQIWYEKRTVKLQALKLNLIELGSDSIIRNFVIFSLQIFPRNFFSKYIRDTVFGSRLKFVSNGFVVYIWALIEIELDLP